MRLHEIPVVGDAPKPAEDGLLTGNAAAVMREIAALLDDLLRTGQGAAVDLKSLPFSAADRQWLIDHLGEGEVEIALDIAGRSHIRETDYAGVWWVEHRNENEATVSEFIEVAYVPDLVSAHPDDVERGLEGLKSRLAGLIGSSRSGA